MKGESPKDPLRKDIPLLLAYYEREKRHGRHFVRCDGQKMRPEEAITYLVEAIASKNWDAFYAHTVDFVSEHELHTGSGIVIGGSD